MSLEGVPCLLLFFSRIQSAVLFCLHLARATRTFPQHHACVGSGKLVSWPCYATNTTESHTLNPESLLFSREKEFLFSTADLRRSRQRRGSISCAAKESRKDLRTPRPTPNTAERKIIDRIVQRCLEELKDESSDRDFRSEPLRALLRGVPSAGKFEVLYWIICFVRRCVQVDTANRICLLAIAKQYGTPHRRANCSLVLQRAIYECFRKHGEYTSTARRSAEHEQSLFAVRAFALDLHRRIPDGWM